MLENLKLDKCYDGFLFLAEAERNPPILRSHHHIELELNLVVRGEITYVVGGRRFTFKKRTLLWLFPSQEHQLVDRSNDAQNYVAVFKPGLIRKSCRGSMYQGLKIDRKDSDGVLHTVLEPQTYDLVRQTIESVNEGSLDADVLNRELGFGYQSDFRFSHNDPDGLNAGLHHLLLLCWRCQSSGKVISGSVSLHPAVCRALQLLDAQTSEADLKLLAGRCGVSETYLSRIFHRQVGVPLSRYRNSLRLGRFWENYRHPVQKTITEAMYSAGFGSYAQFYKVFAEAYGRGPRECLRGDAEQ
jgi:methylphosphotriester-DNA--protein-cysteine methyltransferase